MQTEIETAENIKMWQKLMQEIHPIAQQQLIKLALVLFVDAQKCEIEIQLPEVVNVYLKGYPGIKGLYHKYIKKTYKKHKDNAKTLAETFQFWLPCGQTGKRPKIVVYWQ